MLMILKGLITEQNFVGRFNFAELIEVETIVKLTHSHPSLTRTSFLDINQHYRDLQSHLFVSLKRPFEDFVIHCLERVSLASLERESRRLRLGILRGE